MRRSRGNLLRYRMDMLERYSRVRHMCPSTSRLMMRLGACGSATERIKVRGIGCALMLAGAMSLGLSGCASTPPLKHVLLVPPQASHLPPRGSNWQVALVKVPEYLDSQNIRYRTNDYVIKELPNAQWAEPLPSAITSLLQTTINSKLETGRAKPYTVHVDIATFALQPSGKVVLSGRWRVTNRKSGEVVARDAIALKKSLSTQNRTPESIGRTMSQLVRELAYRIVATVG